MSKFLPLLLLLLRLPTVDLFTTTDLPNPNMDMDDLLWRDVRQLVTSLMAQVCGIHRTCSSYQDLDMPPPTTDVRDLMEQPCASLCHVCYCDHLCHRYTDCCVDKYIDDVIANLSVTEDIQRGETLMSEVADFGKK